MQIDTYAPKGDGLETFTMNFIQSLNFLNSPV